MSVQADDRVALSTITVTPDGLEAIRPSLAALRAQTARDRMEVIVVAPRPCLQGAEELQGFAAARVVSEPFETLGQGIAAGMMAAGAPVVAYAEEHSLPEPGWAAGLIERHRGPWAAVGWAVENANPGTTASWAHLLTDFGPGVAPVASGERFGPLPWHHVSYKRDELLAQRRDLAALVEAEGLLQQRLLDRGGRLFMEGSVTSRHLNISKLRHNLRSHLHGGRAYGAARSREQGWGLSRRLAYALAAPLIAMVRLNRLRPDLRRTRPARGRLPGLVGSLALYLAVDALGEAIGYVVGPGDSRATRLPMELNRIAYVRPADPYARPADPPAPDHAPVSSR